VSWNIDPALLVFSLTKKALLLPFLRGSLREVHHFLSPDIFVPIALALLSTSYLVFV